MANLNSIVDPAQRQQIARNLQLHAHYLSVINSGVIFDTNLYVLKVQRGLYNPGPAEVPTSGSLNDLATQGRCVIYQLVNKGSGQVEISKMYDLAVYLKDYIYFDKLILDYDTYDPSGVMAAHIIIVTPTMPETYQNSSYGNAIETRYNGKTMYSDLVDCYQPAGAAVNTSMSGAGVSGSLPADGVVRATNPNPNELPKQNVIDAVASAVRNLGPGFIAYITPQGGKTSRAAGTINHPLGDAMDHYLTYNGQRINPSQDGDLYRRYLQLLANQARSRGVRPGIGGYPSFIHYDESPWRQGGPGVAGTWNKGFDVSTVLA